MRHVAQSLVLVNYSMPYTVSGVSDRYYYGTGVVADADRGWVVVDRNTVPVAMGDVRITFAGVARDSGARRVHPPAAQSRGRVVRPGTDRQHARAFGTVRRRRAGGRPRRRGRRSRAGSQGDVAGEPDRKRVAGQFPVVAHDPFPRHEPRRDHPRQRSRRLRRCHRRQPRQGCSRTGPVSPIRPVATSRRSTWAYRPISSST